MIDPSTYDDAAMWPGGPDDHGPSRITVRRQIEAWEAVPEEQRMTFEDMLDIVNPLQHIPLVNTAYRELTGDEIRGPARILGGLVYGGPVGFAGAMAEAVYAESTGRDFGATAVAMVFGDDEMRPIHTAADAGVYAEAPPADAGPAVDPSLAQAPMPGGEPAGPILPPGQPMPAILEGLAGPSVSMAPLPGASAASGSFAGASPASGSFAGASPAPLPLPATAGAAAPQPGTGPGSTPLSADSRLDAALMALAMQSEQAVPGASQREDGRRAPAGEPARYAGWPVAAPGRRVPTPQYGQAMSEALNAYQALTPSTGPGSAAGTPPAGGLLGSY